MPSGPAGVRRKPPKAVTTPAMPAIDTAIATTAAERRRFRCRRALRRATRSSASGVAETRSPTRSSRFPTSRIRLLRAPPQRRPPLRREGSNG